VLKPVADVLAEDDGSCTPPTRTSRAWPRWPAAAVRSTTRAGRPAGRIRAVNLAAMVQRLLGLGLAKGHGAADWSKRPLPPAWLNYAALDVEVLIEMRDSIAGRAGGAEQNRLGRPKNSSSICAAPRPRSRGVTAGGAPRVCTRSTPVRVWPRCASCGRCATRSFATPATSPRSHPADSGHRAAALADPRPPRAHQAAIFGGQQAAPAARTCGWPTLEAARNNPEPPDTAEPPRTARRRPCGWSNASPRPPPLDAGRAALSELSARVSVPAENMVSPELVRRLCGTGRTPRGVVRSAAPGVGGLGAG